MAAASSRRRRLNSAVPVRHCRRSLLFAVVLSFLLETSSSSSLSTSALLGIHPRDENYFSGSLIACRDGSGSFPKDRLNDDFCDCPDGTDEPGTSACPESKFYCKNVGDTPLMLFSSRVNDHICDCCDGSDEYDGGILCPNTCLNDGDALFNRTDAHDPMEMKLDNLNTREKKNRVDLEDLIQKLKGLRLVVMIEIVVAICMVTFCLSCRRVRSRRKRVLWRN